MTAKRRITYKKIALSLSLCAIILWAILGTGASLAWFTDTSEEVRNVFHMAEFDLEVSHRLEDGTYEVIEGDTRIFDDYALYEPGYVQVVYLKIENKGTVPFDFKTAINIADYTVAQNVFGQSFNLHDYLKFGLVTDASEEALMQKLQNRDLAKKVANMKPQNYYTTDDAELGAGKTMYMALIVRMPEEVKNEANYRGDDIPMVKLGIIFSASQQKD